MKATVMKVADYLSAPVNTTRPTPNRTYKHVVTPAMIVAEWDKMAQEGHSPSAGGIQRRLNIVNPASGKLMSRQQILNLLKLGDPDRFGKISKQKPHARKLDKPIIIIREFAPSDWRNVFPDAQVMLQREVEASPLLLLERTLAIGEQSVPLHLLTRCKKILHITGDTIYAYRLEPRPLL